MTCEPAVTLEEYFAAGRPFEKPIFDAVHSYIGDLEGLIIDPIGIGILLKNGPMFAELRTKTKWTALGFSLGRKLESNRMSRKVAEVGPKYFHVINVSDPNEIDDQVSEWLIEAYHLAGGTQHSHQTGGGMVPDDVDDFIS